MFTFAAVFSGIHSRYSWIFSGYANGNSFKTVFRLARFRYSGHGAGGRPETEVTPVLARPAVVRAITDSVPSPGEFAFQLLE